MKEQEENNKKLPVVARALEIIQGEEIKLFHDPQGRGYAVFLDNDGYRQTQRIKSDAFRRYLGGLCFKKKKLFTKDQLEHAIFFLDGKACHDSPERNLHLRVASVGGRYFYDLGGAVVEVKPGSFRVIDSSPIYFLRYPGMLPQVAPQGGSVDEIFEFLNLPDKRDQLLLVTFLVCALIPDIAHPVLALYGPEGSAKSTLLRTLTDLIDPSSASDLPAADQRDFTVVVGHRWVVPLDNLSPPIKPWLSDFLCKLVTGAASMVRKLHTDDETVIRSYRRVIILNGVSLPVSKPDLLDRCLLLELDRIKPEKRVEEAKLVQKMQEAKPRILGGMLKLLSEAMEIKGSIELQKKPRLADYGVWAAAVAQAWGSTPDDFLEAFERNIAIQTQEALEASPFGAAIQCLLESKKSFEGTATELLRAIDFEIAKPDSNIDRRFLPNTATQVGRQLTKLKSALQNLGYTVEQKRGRKRIWVLAAPNVCPSVDSDGPSCAKGWPDTTFDGYSRHNDAIDTEFDPMELK